MKNIYSRLAIALFSLTFSTILNAQTVGISTSGTSSVGNVLHTGNMGVATTTLAPNTKFQISNYLTFGGSGNEIYFNAYRNGPSSYAMVNGQSGYLSLAGEFLYANSINGIAGSAIELTNRFIIKTNGNVGIGTSTPSEMLHVNGTIRSSKIRIGDKHAIGTHGDYLLSVGGKILAQSIVVTINDKDNWADYVFKKEYKLAALSDVENFIKTEGHLKDIPTSEEVLKNGVDIAVMNAKLLEKVEELTLYMIEMKKENEVLRSRISTLESK